MKKLLFIFTIFLSLQCFSQKAYETIKYTGGIGIAIVYFNYADGYFEGSEIKVKQSGETFIYMPEKSTTNKQVFVLYKDGKYDYQRYFEVSLKAEESPGSSVKANYMENGRKIKVTFYK